MLSDSLEALRAATTIAERKPPTSTRELWELGSALRNAHLALEKLIKSRLARHSELLLLTDLKEKVLHDAIAARIRKAPESPSLLSGPLALKTHTLEKAWRVMNEVLDEPASDDLKAQVELTIKRLAALRNPFQHGEVYVDVAECALTLRQSVLRYYELMQALDPRWKTLLDKCDKDLSLTLEALAEEVDQAWLVILKMLDQSGHIDFQVKGYLTTQEGSTASQVLVTAHDPKAGLGFAAYDQHGSALAEGVFAIPQSTDLLEHRRQEQRSILLTHARTAGLPPSEETSSPKPKRGVSLDGREELMAALMSNLSRESHLADAARAHIGLPMLSSGRISFTNVPTWITVRDQSLASKPLTANGSCDSLNLSIDARPTPGTIIGEIRAGGLTGLKQPDLVLRIAGELKFVQEYIADGSDAALGPEFTRSFTSTLRLSR